MDKTRYPLAVLKDLKGLLKELNYLSKANIDIIEPYDYDSAVIAFRPISEPSFYFDLIGPDYKPDFVSYSINILPTDELNNGLTSYNLDKNGVVDKFREWISLMKEYDTFSFSDDEVITKQYEEEFYADFEILDDDADEKAFEPEKQVLLYKWLTALEQDLKSSEMIDQAIPLIEETAALRDDIQNLTKKQFVRRFAILMSKVKKSGLKLLFEVLDIAKKEALKKVLYGGLKGLGDITEHVINALT